MYHQRIVKGVAHRMLWMAIKDLDSSTAHKTLGSV
jgi:hypothetical protein